MNRRDLLRTALGVIAWPAAARDLPTDFAPVVPGRTLQFPDDEGSHPEFRTEWWYVTGWLDVNPAPLGFQVTFFRTRPHPETPNPSRFNPRHILIAHAAISDPGHGRLRHESRSARAGFGLAQAAIGKTNVWIDAWQLRSEQGHYSARIDARDFSLALDFKPTQAPLLHGENGFSRKGPDPASASYYYSFPHLRVRGRIRIDSKSRDVTGSAWFDHEWSSQIMEPQAVGWDWVGLNMDDGAAIMAFKMRGRDGGTHWAGATVRDAAGVTRILAPREIAWETQRHWRSPRSGASYPVATQLRLGESRLDLTPLMDDQESDTRLSTGAIYWEGAVTAASNGQRVGRGYLELTGYVKPLSF
jgi:predicted secreted hydrolase